MKTLSLTSHPPSVPDLLSMARKEPVLVTTAAGECFLVSPADDFESEVQLLRRNHTFLTLLDGLKADEGRIPLAEVERTLR